MYGSAHWKLSTVTAAGILLLATASGHAAPEVLGGCGQTVSDAVLAADLDCSGFAGFAVTIAPGGTLDLAGHELLSGPTASATSEGGGVMCEGNCAILGGGGSIVSSVPPGWGVQTSGVDTPWPWRGKVAIFDTSISGYEIGATGRYLTIDSSVLTDNGVGCVALRRLTLLNSRVTNNALWHFQAAEGQDVFIANSTLIGGGGVRGKRIKLYRTTVSGMNDFGVSVGYRTGSIRAKESVVDGNCVEAGSSHCADLFSSGRKVPDLIDTACSTSARQVPHTEAWSSWGVCSLD